MELFWQNTRCSPLEHVVVSMAEKEKILSMVQFGQKNSNVIFAILVPSLKRKSVNVN